jgi:hypothetical protein
MTKPGTEGRDQGPGTRDQAEEPLAVFLRRAVPPVENRDELTRDLWPAMQQRLRQQNEIASGLKAVPWFDWALAGGVALFGVAFPAAIPMLLYYL